MRNWLAVVLIGVAVVTLRSLTTRASDAPTGVRATRLPDNPILRPDMMPKDDGEWSGNLDFPSVIRAPDWLPRPLGRYYLYFGAHHGTYIRLAYADQLTGPWKVYEPGTLRLAQVEAANHSPPVPAGQAINPLTARHVASPDVHVDDERRQIRMYFHYSLPTLGHKSSVAVSTDGLAFEPRPGAIAGPYLRAFRRGGAYFALDDQGALLRSPDGLEPFQPVSDAVKRAALAAPKTDAGARPSFRHGGVSLDGDVLSVFFTRVGDAPERILFTRVRLAGEPASWAASPAQVVLEPERDYEGASGALAPSSVVGQTNVRQLRDPFVYREGGHTYLFYAVAGETGIAVAELHGL